MPIWFDSNSFFDFQTHDLFCKTPLIFVLKQFKYKEESMKETSNYNAHSVMSFWYDNLPSTKI